MSAFGGDDYFPTGPTHVGYMGHGSGCFATMPAYYPPPPPPKPRVVLPDEVERRWRLEGERMRKENARSLYGIPPAITGPSPLELAEQQCSDRFGVTLDELRGSLMYWSARAVGGCGTSWWRWRRRRARRVEAEGYVKDAELKLASLGVVAPKFVKPRPITPSPGATMW